MIVIVFGLPGSGKSYFASRFARLLQANYINSDKIRKEMFPQRTYALTEKGAVYARMLDLVEQGILAKKDLILDATFHKDHTRELFVEKVQGRTPVYFIEIEAEEAVTRDRVKKARPYSEADFEVYKLIKQQNEPLNEPHLILKSTNDNLAEMLQQGEDYLKINNDRRPNQ